MPVMSTLIKHERTASPDIPPGPKMCEPDAATAAQEDPLPTFDESPPERPDLQTTERRSPQSEARLDKLELVNVHAVRGNCGCWPGGPHRVESGNP
jgi:hypothetical protein